MVLAQHFMQDLWRLVKGYIVEAITPAKEECNKHDMIVEEAGERYTRG